MFRKIKWQIFVCTWSLVLKHGTYVLYVDDIMFWELLPGHGKYVFCSVWGLKPHHCLHSLYFTLHHADWIHFLCDLSTQTRTGAAKSTIIVTCTYNISGYAILESIVLFFPHKNRYLEHVIFCINTQSQKESAFVTLVDGVIWYQSAVGFDTCFSPDCGNTWKLAKWDCCTLSGPCKWRFHAGSPFIKVCT